MADNLGQGWASEGEITSLFALWREPLVFVNYLGMQSKTALKIATAVAAGRPCHILTPPLWRLSSLIDHAVELDRWLADEHPNARLTIMATTEPDLALAASRGLAAIWASHTAFIDERIFYPELDAPKLYDAVHNANTGAFKRHALARQVGNLALITYLMPGRPDNFAEVIGGYSNLAYVNWSQGGGHRLLSAAGVRNVVNQARCGVVVSALEGANNASMEYFLCGLPLVTTASEGGREQMYDPRHVTVVEPDAEAVAAAVAAYQIAGPDPLEIRAAALARARAHRGRLIAWLSDVAGRDLSALADGQLWLPQFTDKLLAYWRMQPRAGGGFDARPV
jgi:glycosyltransferase involved in cell wall biosynthesis